MIELKNINKFYATSHVLKNINLSFGRGEITGLLGPNGAGKTTVMRIISTYIKPDSGEVIIKGINAVEDSISVKKYIGYLPENVPLYTEMRINEFLNYRAILKSVSKKKRKNIIDEVLEKCALTDVKNKIIGHLSKGFSQRVGLADALLAQPEILILDEPTSGLDPAQRAQVRNIINELSAERSIIISTHILSEVETMCQSVVIINQGEIITREKISDLKKSDSKIGQEYRIVLSGDISKNLFDNIETKFFIVKIEDIKYIDNVKVLKIVLKNNSDAVDALIQFLNNNNLRLRELTPVKKTLESIFISLTL